MKKFGYILLASGMILSLAACGNTKAEEEMPVDDPVEEIEEMPDSLLYYGEVLEIDKNEDGSIASVLMDSQAKGRWSMIFSEETVFIDSGNFLKDQSEINVGDRMYVFHIPLMTMSIPPQSGAFAVVRNIPMDARCAMYHEIEEVSRDGDNVIITTDNGKMKLKVTDETEISAYSGSEVTKDDITSGKHIMAIYMEIMNQAPQDPELYKIMILPD